MRDHDLTRKIILYGILIILLVSTIVIGYYTLGDQNRHNTKAIIAIPENACIIIELKNPAEFPSDNSDLKSFIGKVSGDNELKIFGNNLSEIQRLLSGKDDFNDITKDGVLYISLHKLSNNKTACLYSINIKDKELPLNKFIKDNYGNRFSIKHELYKGVTIYSLTEKNDKGEFYYFISKEVLACCNSPELIKNSAEQIISPYSILNDKNFSKLSKSAEIKADANVYINYNMFPDLRNFA
ncbi:MAG: hypothetical protein Q8880_02660, partial [Bacteroidota bacterium]|nr:hypothetical protein [Bacteroidota bacterium]